MARRKWVPEPATEGEVALVARFNAGDRGAQGLVWTGMVKAVRARMRRHFRNREDVDELTQDVYLLLVPALTQFKGDRRLIAIGRRLAKSRAFDELRSRTTRRRLVPLEERQEQTDENGDAYDPLDDASYDDDIDPERKFAACQDSEQGRALLQRTLKALPRMIFVLRHVEELDIPGIAEFMAMKPPAVQKLLRQANDRMELVAEGVDA
jgi:RNA polymerase sigma factor (sigma-70 family)